MSKPSEVPQVAPSRHGEPDDHEARRQLAPPPSLGATTSTKPPHSSPSQCRATTAFFLLTTRQYSTARGCACTNSKARQGRGGHAGVRTSSSQGQRTNGQPCVASLSRESSTLGCQHDRHTYETRGELPARPRNRLRHQSAAAEHHGND